MDLTSHLSLSLLLLSDATSWFCRRVIEGASSREASTTFDDSDSDLSSSSDEDEARAKGVVYRVSKGKVKLMERGMDQYVELVEKGIAKRERLAAAAAAAAKGG